ncbi:MAG: tetratricopeptide repeat protein [Bacteroidota bacterium]|nr:tetratricopeptide repeat protein [Bacteroidota bacterium]
MKKLIIAICGFILLSLVGVYAWMSNSGIDEPATKTAASTITIPELKEREGELASSTEWPETKSKYQELTAKVKANPDDMMSYLRIAQIFMAEARITGDHPYYYPSTLHVLDGILKKNPENFEALAFKSSVLLSQHRFSEALATGEKARKINGSNAYIYGVLCDAHVELGNYKEAIKMSDLMQQIRPGLDAYSRASYLREIHGDNKGAIDAMKLAVEAGAPGSEYEAWARHTLGILYEQTGKLNEARLQYTIILQHRPSYAFAVAGQGRIAKAQGDYKEAITLLEKAAGIIPEFSFYEELAELYELTGNADKAAKTRREVVTMLMEDEQSGHLVDLELAKAYLAANDLNKALAYADKEYKRRPGNIDVNLAKAWIHYKKGDVDLAQKHMNAALVTGSKNAELLSKAGIVAIHSGNTTLGKNLIREALAMNANLAPALLKEAKNSLHS